MQLKAGIGAQTNDIAGVRRDFGFKQDDIKHESGPKELGPKDSKLFAVSGIQRQPYRQA